MNETHDNVTVVSDDVYDELMTETPDEPNEKLRAAAQRARELITQN